MGLSDCCCQAALVWALCVVSVLMTSFTDLYSVPLSLIFSHCISRLSYLSQVCMYHFGTLHSEFTFRCIACTVSYKVSSFFFLFIYSFFFPFFCLLFRNMDLFKTPLLKKTIFSLSEWLVTCCCVVSDTHNQSSKSREHPYHRNSHLSSYTPIFLNPLT